MLNLPVSFKNNFYGRLRRKSVLTLLGNNVTATLRYLYPFMIYHVTRLRYNLVFRTFRRET